MPEDELIALDFEKHELQCPHCKKPRCTTHPERSSSLPPRDARIVAKTF